MKTGIENLRAAEVMSEILISAAPEQDLAEVEALLIEHRIGGRRWSSRGGWWGWSVGETRRGCRC